MVFAGRDKTFNTEQSHQFQAAQADPAFASGASVLPSPSSHVHPVTILAQNVFEVTAREAPPPSKPEKSLSLERDLLRTLPALNKHCNASRPIRYFLRGSPPRRVHGITALTGIGFPEITFDSRKPSHIPIEHGCNTVKAKQYRAIYCSGLFQPYTLFLLALGFEASQVAVPVLTHPNL